ncbi:amidohydrolase family protein [Candidatus Peregrinibacteria bacterium]|nr:amidohydrolase family protein [Candidatus Peregrinibacteria bacterium]
MKKLHSTYYILHSILLLVLLSQTAFAQEMPKSDVFKDGSAIRLKGTQKNYLIVNGEKRLIENFFTLNELGIKLKNVSKVEKEIFDNLPLGEPIKISPPKIKGMFDMHEHYRNGAKPEQYLDIADRLGIEKVIFVPTGEGPDNKGYKKHTEALFKAYAKYPDRIIPFCTIDEADMEAPKIFEQCLDRGGKGLKLIGGHPNFYDVPLDNDIVKQLFNIAEKRDMPVMVHVSIITQKQAKEEFKNVLDQFPFVRVQFAHYCSSIYDGINLDQCAEFLDKYPNLYIDLSMGGGIARYFKYMTETGGLEKIKDFILKYQDRIFYGTDSIIAGAGPTTDKKWLRARMMCDLSLHQEKWYRCPAINKGEYTLLPGFNLPEDVLRKLYVDNPKKFLKIE